MLTNAAGSKNSNRGKAAASDEFSPVEAFVPRQTLSSNMTAYFKVTNLTNLAPVPAPQTNVGYDFNPALYDVIGRMYRAGIRLNF